MQRIPWGFRLKPTNYIPSAVLGSLPGFISVVQTRIDAENRVNVTIGEQETDASSLSTFIFDIDRISEKVLPADTPSLLQETTRLHEDVWKLFDTAKTETLERLPNGELPLMTSAMDSMINFRLPTTYSLPPFVRSGRSPEEPPSPSEGGNPSVVRIDWLKELSSHNRRYGRSTALRNGPQCQSMGPFRKQDGGKNSTIT